MENQLLHQQQILVVEFDTLNDDIFICGRCKTVFTTLPLYLEHKNQICSETANKQPSVGHNSVPDGKFALDATEPLRSHEKVDAYNNSACTMCSNIFLDSKTLIHHIKTQHNGKPYQCIICGRCFSQNSHLKRHELSHKVWPDGISGTTTKSPTADTLCYACMYCNLDFSSYGQFRIHLKNHIAQKKYKCAQTGCIELFNSIELLLDHVASVHQSPTYSCPICELCFNTLEESSVHQQNKSNCRAIDKKNATSYKCPQCDAIFKTNEKLKRHITADNHKKCCIHCSKIFTSDKRLRQHLQIHKNKKPFRCNICKQCFSMKKYLTNHLLKHSEKKFACSVCSHKFKRKDLLKRHEKIHHSKRYLKCPFKTSMGCKMEFNRNDKLNLHVKQHTKQAPVPSTSKTLQKESSSTVEILIVPFEGNE